MEFARSGRRLTRDDDLGRGRAAVAVLFVINGVALANVIPRLPAIKADLSLSNSALGTAVAAMPAGALLSAPAAGWLIGRFSSGRVAVACALTMGLVLPGFAFAPRWGALVAVFLVFGLLDSLMDVAMNAHGLRVQRGYGRSIVSSFHGLWSAGAVVGAAAATVAVGTGMALELHLVVAGALLITMALTARRWLLIGPDDLERSGTTVERERSAGDGRRRSVKRQLALLGLVAMLSAVIEDAPASWGAVLLRTELGAPAATAGLVFVAFQAAMTVSRLCGDRFVDRYGDVAVVRAGGLVAATGVAVGLAVGEPFAVIVGFGVAGAGTALLFPLVFRAAGNLGGVSTGHGIAAVAWLSRVGFLVVPPLVGVLGDVVNLRVGLCVVPVAGVLVALLAGALRAP